MIKQPKIYLNIDPNQRRVRRMKCGRWSDNLMGWQQQMLIATVPSVPPVWD
jgi:hypothetical protein